MNIVKSFLRVKFKSDPGVSKSDIARAVLGDKIKIDEKKALVSTKIDCYIKDQKARVIIKPEEVFSMVEETQGIDTREYNLKVINRLKRIDYFKKDVINSIILCDLVLLDIDMHFEESVELFKKKFLNTSCEFVKKSCDVGLPLTTKEDKYTVSTTIGPMEKKQLFDTYLFAPNAQVKDNFYFLQVEVSFTEENSFFSVDKISEIVNSEEKVIDSYISDYKKYLNI